MAARKSFPLRLSPQLYEELRRWAEAELRSVNGQIEYLLRRAVRERRGLPLPDEPPPDAVPPDEDRRAGS